MKRIINFIKSFFTKKNSSDKKTANNGVWMTSTIVNEAPTLELLNDGKFNLESLDTNVCCERDCACKEETPIVEKPKRKRATPKVKVDKESVNSEEKVIKKPVRKKKTTIKKDKE